MIEKFSKRTIEQLGYYVYGLRYPGTKTYFYIGKGTGNRVFSHVQQKTKHGITDPKFEILQELSARNGPEVDIIRHGLTEHNALLLESTLIDVLDVKQIANKVRGIDAEQFGLMSVKNIEEQYKGLKFRRTISAVCFKINKRWHKDMSAAELYESIRGDWRLNIERASKAEYGIGLKDGVIRAIYRVNAWHVVSARTPTRYRFDGTLCPLMEKYTGYTLLDHPSHAVRGPLFYINC